MIRAAALATKPSNNNAKPAVRDELRKGLVAISPELFGRALRLSRSQHVAQDLVQDTIERAIRFQAQYEPGTNLRAWMYQILFSVFVTRCRRLRRERNAMGRLSTDPCEWTAVDHAKASAGLTPSMKRALKSLPASFRKAVTLVDLQELPYKDAADKMGVPVGTVMSRLHRGRKMLANIIRENERKGDKRAELRGIVLSMAA
jgi:RNA polymerase sigma-70 factor (ECF subfamily)